MVRHCILTWVTALGLVLLSAPGTVADVTNTLSYQGMLEDSSGQAVTGTVSMTFSIYDVASGGTALWSETHGSVSVTDGLYSVVLGSNTSLALPVCTNYWLGVSVGGDPEMNPRTPLTGALIGVLPNLGSHTIMVQKTGPGFTTIGAALDSITDNGSDSRYTIKVGPGLFEEQVVMKPYVSLEGSGRWSTRIQYHGSDAADYSGATVIMADDCELKGLSVNSNGQGSGSQVAYAVGILVKGASPYIHQISVYSWNAVTNLGMVIANDGETVSSPVMVLTRIRGIGGDSAIGVKNELGTSPGLVNSRLEAFYGVDSFGVWNETSNASFNNCTIQVLGNSSASGLAHAALNYSGAPYYKFCRFETQDGYDGVGFFAENSNFYMRQCEARALARNSAMAYSVTGGMPQIRYSKGIAYTDQPEAFAYGLKLVSPDPQAFLIASSFTAQSQQHEAVGMEIEGGKVFAGRCGGWAWKSRTAIGARITGGAQVLATYLASNAEGYASPGEGDNAGAAATALVVDSAGVSLVNGALTTDYSEIQLGIWTQGSAEDPATLDVENSHVAGGADSVRYGSNSTVRVSSSRVLFGGDDQGGTIKCVYCVNDDFDQLDSTCEVVAP